MSDYGVTDKGFVIKRMDKILEEVEKELSTEFGFDVSELDDQSVLTVIIRSMCGQLADLWEVAQESYFAKFPSSATGVNLDNAIQFGGVRRRMATHSVYTLHCKGVDGTEVVKGSVVGTNTSPQIRLDAKKDFVISRESCNSAEVKIASLGEGTYSITLNGKSYAYDYHDGVTDMDILSALANMFEDTEYIATYDEEQSVLIISAKEQDISFNMELSENMTTESVTTLAEFETEDYGVVKIANGCVTDIISLQSGFEEVTNLLKPVYGEEAASDLETRLSYVARSQLRSNTMLGSVTSAIIDTVEGVQSAIGYENASSESDSEGRPPHSIEIVVDGGNEESIAEVILRKKASGIQTYGDITVALETEFGDDVNISFNRPEIVYVWTHVFLQGDKSVVPANASELVKDIIGSYADSLNCGESMYSQKCFGEIYDTVPGLTSVTVISAKSDNVNSKPTSNTFTNVNIVVTSRQKIDLSSDRIEVQLNGKVI